MKVCKKVGFILLCLVTNLVYSQDNLAIVKQEMNKILSVYRTDAMMRVTVKSDIYLSTQPGELIEKSVATYLTQNNRVLANISDGTTYLQNDKWSMVMLNNAKEMYIDSLREDQVNPKANPLQMTDTTFLMANATYQITEMGNNQRKITASFPDSFQIKQCYILYDKETNHVIRTQYFLPVSQEQMPGPSSAYYVLTMAFSDGISGDGDAILFDEGQYFQIVNNKFIPATPYWDYKVITIFPSEETED